VPIPRWPLPLPAHYRIRYCTPIELDHEHPGADPDDPVVVSAAATMVRAAIEHELEIMRAVRRGVFR
jgi:hypothetical protein